MSKRTKVWGWDPEVTLHGRRLLVDLTYPRVDDHCHEVEVGMMCVRAADSIRIRYDFDRDGWSILQASTFEWEPDDEEQDWDWQEVAFVQAWGREKPPSWESTPREQEA